MCIVWSHLYCVVACALCGRMRIGWSHAHWVVVSARSSTAPRVTTCSLTSALRLVLNAACAAIRVNQLGLAEKLLKRAIDLCRETLSSDDYTEEEIEVPGLAWTDCIDCEALL